MDFNQIKTGLPNPYYQDEWVMQYHSDALSVLRELEGESIDLLVTDPPYGIGFMGKDWDKALPDKRIWVECLRVLKPGAFGFVMSIPRADCLSRMIISLEDAGFLVNFTPIFWAYASGFPKAQNISLAIDKQECRKQLTEKLGRKPTKEEFDEAWKAFREVVGKAKHPTSSDRSGNKSPFQYESHLGSNYGITAPTTPQAKALDGSYGGFQPKPAVEVIIVCMKPLSEKTFVDQALKNGKGITWLDDGRIPLQGIEEHRTEAKSGLGKAIYGEYENKPLPLSDLPRYNNQGRFPANLLVSDDVLNDGKVSKSIGGTGLAPLNYKLSKNELEQHYFNYGDSGSFSRYFDLDKWFEKRSAVLHSETYRLATNIERPHKSAQKTFPFLIVPKASKSEKNKGLGDIEPTQTNDGRNKLPDNAFQRGKTYRTNSHPTVKPLKLMSYLITLGSRPSDITLDPFGGSGTMALASKLLGRKCIILEIKEKYCEISVKRYSQGVMELKV